MSVVSRVPLTRRRLLQASLATGDSLLLPRVAQAGSTLVNPCKRGHSARLSPGQRHVPAPTDGELACGTRRAALPLESS